jgi:hypothetical protein
MENQMNSEDAQQLYLLSVFHFVFGGLLALFSCLPLIHVVIGILMVSGKFLEGAEGTNAPDAAFGWIFVVMGSFFILCGWVISAFVIIAGVKLRKRRNRIFCMVIGAIECMFMPFGTVLGVFTLIALNKESIKQTYGQPVVEAVDDASV